MVSMAADFVDALGEKVAQVQSPLDLPNMAFHGAKSFVGYYDT